MSFQTKEMDDKKNDLEKYNKQLNENLKKPEDEKKNSEKISKEV